LASGVLISGKLNRMKIGSKLALIVASPHVAAYRYGWMSLISTELSKVKIGSPVALINCRDTDCCLTQVWLDELNLNPHELRPLS
jgi:hypothetical protein